jgi:pimeloyl-ACP methyl ester carboxylesterase
VIANERRVALGDGAETTLEVWGERGPLVLAIHGMTSSRKAWRRLADHWNGRFRVAAYDQRGHGDSAGVTGPMALVRGVQDALDVAATLDEPPSALLGHSWGGAVSILAGTRLPVTRVATLDPMLHQASQDWYGEYVVELREHFALQGDERDAATRASVGDWDPVDVEGKVHAMHAMTAEPIERLLRENPPLVWDVRPAILDYPKPLLLLMAAPGEGINDQAIVEAVRRDRSAKVSIEEIDGAGHNLHRTDFAEVARSLDTFLMPLQANS